jgi:hypothetical protein
VYKSLADFYTDANAYIANPSRTGPAPVTLDLFQYRYANIPGMKEPVQPLDVIYAGLYVQDEFRPTPELTLTAGLRVDAPKFGHTAYDNAVADTMHFRNADGTIGQYNSGALPPVNPLLSPRLGFNYDLLGQHKTQIRGGTGVFSGRPAYVWISNQVGNTGVLTGFISATNTTAYPFNPNNTAYAPPASAITGGPAASFELNFTDKNFKFPQSWRTNLAVDQRLPLGLTGTVEWVYTKDMNGIGYVNVNLPAAQSWFTGFDVRPRWTSNRIYNNVSDAPVLTNEGVGHAYNLSFTIERPTSRGLYFKVGYTFGESFNTGDPGSIAFGNWTGITSSFDPNNPGLGYSSFSPGSRLFAAMTYNRDFFGVGATTLGLYLNGQTWGNGSYVFSNDMNGDGVSGNDLVYIPKSTKEMNFDTLKVGSVVYTPAQEAAAWDAFINQDPYLSKHRGQYAQRNAAFLPWVWRLDGSISQDIGAMVGGQRNRLQVRLDILNLTNFINRNWGIGQSFTSTRPLTFVKADATGAALYRLATVGTNLIASSYTKTAGSGDVWRFQVSLRYMFN